MTKDEISAKWEESIDSFSKECKQVSLWGIGIAGAFLFHETFASGIHSSWILLVAFVFGFAILSNLFISYNRMSFWTKTYNSKEVKPTTEDPAQKRDEMQFRGEEECNNAFMAFIANILGFLLLAICFAAKNSLNEDDFKGLVSLLWLIVIGITSCFMLFTIIDKFCCNNKEK